MPGVGLVLPVQRAAIGDGGQIDRRVSTDAGWPQLDHPGIVATAVAVALRPVVCARLQRCAGSAAMPLQWPSVPSLAWPPPMSEESPTPSPPPTGWLRTAVHDHRLQLEHDGHRAVVHHLDVHVGPEPAGRHRGSEVA